MKFVKSYLLRPVTIIMATLAVVLLGSISVFKLPIDLFPNVESPYLMVDAYYNAGPKEMENLVTKHLEDALNGLNDIKQISSFTSSGMSMLFVELEVGSDIDFASLEARELLDDVKTKLPKGIVAPTISKVNPNDPSILEIGILMDKAINEVKHFADKKIKPQLERIDGVGSVKINGGDEKKVVVELSKEAMQTYQVSPSYISEQVAKVNKTYASGYVSLQGQNIFITTKSPKQSIHKVSDMYINLPSGHLIALRELGDVTFKTVSSDSKATMNGKEWISMSIKKEPNSNIVRVGSAINDRLKTLGDRYPEATFKVMYDQSKIIKDLIKNVAKSALVGGLLAVIVIFIFLNDFKATFIISLTLPVAMVATFALMFLTKVSINMMTLGGLALGVGMLVDNSIVVLENIHRHLQDKEPLEAAVVGTKEVMLSVLASTMTTVAVFIPIVFIKGFIAQLFRELALTVSFSLAVSFVVSVTIIPVLCRLLLKKESIKSHWFDRLFKKFSKAYEKKLIWGLKNKGKVIIISVLMLALSFMSLMLIGYELFPNSDDGFINITITLPGGMKIEDTEAVLNDLASQMQALNDIETTYAMLGTDGGYGKAENTGSIILELKKERQFTIDELKETIRYMGKDIPGCKIDIDSQSVVASVSGNEKFYLSLYGEDYETISDIAEDLGKTIKDVEGVKAVKLSTKSGTPEVQVVIDNEKARYYNLTADDIGMSISDFFRGISNASIKEKDRVYKIELIGDKSQRTYEKLKTLPIIKGQGKSVPLNAVAEIDIQNGPNSISKEDKKINVSITAVIEGRDLGGVTKDIIKLVNAYQMPHGYSHSLKGQAKEMDTSFGELRLVLIIAIVIVYMILTSQFESLLNPFIIMLSVPLAFAGGVLGLWLFKQPMSVPALIGSIVLSGVVVNDAILLIDYINIQRQEGLSRFDAIVKAGPVRLKPILMTTLTTVLALVPMLVVKKAGTLAPMAAMVIGGLLMADLLLLIFVPVLYDIFEKFKDKVVSK